MEYLALTSLAILLTVTVTRGDWHQVLTTRFHQPTLLLVGLSIQIAVGAVSRFHDVSPGMWTSLYLVSAGFLVTFFILNRRLAGTVFIAIGIVLNAIAIGTNQGMPTRTPSGHPTITRSAKHQPADDSDRVPWLTDVIQIPGPMPTMVSLGDLAIACGICVAAFSATRKPRSDELVRASESESFGDA